MPATTAFTAAASSGTGYATATASATGGNGGITFGQGNDVPGGDTTALTEITDIQDLLLRQEEPDLPALARLNVHRNLIADESDPHVLRRDHRLAVDAGNEVARLQARVNRKFAECTDGARPRHLVAGRRRG